MSFLEDELRAWSDGAELEVIKLAHGGRIVRPAIQMRGKLGSCCSESHGVAPDKAIPRSHADKLRHFYHRGRER